MAQDSLYVIGIGGTGAKCLEAIIQLAGVGLFTKQPIRLLFVDADETNGNLERAQSTLSTFKQCYDILKSEQKDLNWMQTPIESYNPNVWSPFGTTSLNKNLGTFFGYNNLEQNHETLAHLFNILYTEDEKEANLDVGFRGRPAIGSAIMSRLDLDKLQEDPWASLITQIKADQGKGSTSKIFLCGSIFGGTGASGLPTLGQLIDNKLKKEGIRAKVQIACLFVLPYFQFSPPTGEEAVQEVYANSDQFLLNTEAALQYYRDQNNYFDMVYLLGNQNFSKYRFSLGKNTQKNEPHFLEIYAALAARDFLVQNSLTTRETVILNARSSADKITWKDLPERELVQNNMANAVRFAYAWLSNLLPELNTAKKMGVGNFQKGAPWFINFFRPEQGVVGKLLDKKGEDLPDFNATTEQEAIRVITEWCRSYLNWIRDVHQCDGDDVQLFRYRAFDGIDGQVRGEYLNELVLGDTREQGLKQRDTIQAIKVALVNLPSARKGTVGLAQELYKLCRLA
jgi:hypothetical protein